jgi:multidrug efflux system outer membrane protein
MSKEELLNGNEKRLTRLVLIAAGCLAVLTTGGCMVGPNYHHHQPTVPAEWVGVSKTPTGHPSVATAQPADLTRWWLQFNDPTLTALVEEALEKNLDLQIAETRLRQARAIRGVAVGGLWPAVAASGSYQRLHRTGASPDDQDLYQAG